MTIQGSRGDSGKETGKRKNGGTAWVRELPSTHGLGHKLFDNVFFFPAPFSSLASLPSFQYFFLFVLENKMTTGALHILSRSREPRGELSSEWSSGVTCAPKVKHERIQCLQRYRDKGVSQPGRINTS